MIKEAYKRLNVSVILSMLSLKCSLPTFFFNTADAVLLLLWCKHSGDHIRLHPY